MSKLIVSDGGHIYDKNTGTWLGETQGSFGDGFKHGPAEGGFVWRDANGITGISYTEQTRPGGGGSASQGAATGQASNGVAPPLQAGGAGPGSPGVVSGGGGGTGPGSSEVVKTGGLKEKLSPTVTKLMVGGPWWQTNPWFSDADEWTKRYGEGELAETFFFLTTSVADVTWNTMFYGDKAGKGVEQMWSDRQAQVSAPPGTYKDQYGRTTFQEPSDIGF